MRQACLLLLRWLKLLPANELIFLTTEIRSTVIAHMLWKLIEISFRTNQGFWILGVLECREAWVRLADNQVNAFFFLPGHTDLVIFTEQRRRDPVSPTPHPCPCPTRTHTGKGKWSGSSWTGYIQAADSLYLKIRVIVWMCKGQTLPGTCGSVV